MLDENVRSNAMRGFQVDLSVDKDDYDKCASEVEDAENQSTGLVATKKPKSKKNSANLEFSNSKTKRSFLPAEVSPLIWYKTSPCGG